MLTILGVYIDQFQLYLYKQCNLKWIYSLFGDKNVSWTVTYPFFIVIQIFIYLDTSKYVVILTITIIINIIFGMVMVTFCLIMQCYYLSKKRKKVIDDHKESSNFISPNSPIYCIPVDSFTTPADSTYGSMSRICDPDWKLPQQYNSLEAVI